MSPRFTSDSPVVRDVMTILRQHPDGLTVPEIRRAVLRAGRPGVLERDIEAIVQLSEFRRLPGGRVILQEMEQGFVEEEDAVGSGRPDQPYADEPSTLRDLPSLDEYVIFDVETNGLDPTTADFFQLSAIKVIGGRPVDATDLYARVDTNTITRALQVKLHFDELGLGEKIQNAGTQAEALAQFCDFAGGLPLVAHNGTFDIAFLRKHDPDLPNALVDSLELFCLAFPAEPSHSLERLAPRFGLSENGDRWSEVLALDQMLGVSAGLGVEPSALFHSAIFDCLILHLLFQDALTELRSLSPLFKARVRLVSPSLARLIEQTSASETSRPTRDDASEISVSTPDSPPDDLGDLITLRGWNTDAPALNHVPEPGLKFDESTVFQLYKGVLAKQDWEERGAQREMIRHITRIFDDDGGQAMIEAPTGTGKTLAYVLPALVLARATGQQVVISTSTKALQDQLLRDLETRIKPAVDFGFQFAVLKGQENYLCLTKLWDAFLEAYYGPAADEVPFEEKLALLYLLRYAEASPTGDLQNTSFWLQKRFPILEYLKARLASEPETCGGACSYFRHCFHPRAKSVADRADLLVVNHTLLLVRRWAEDRLLNLILDEAHNLEDVATNTLTQEASQAQIETLLARLLRPDGRRGALVRARRWVSDTDTLNQAMGGVRRLRRRNREFGAYLREFLGRQGVNFHRCYGARWRMRAAPHRAHYFAWEHVERARQELLRELNELDERLVRISAQLAAQQENERAISLERELQAIRVRLIGAPDTPGQRDLLKKIPQVGFDPLKVVHWIDLGVEGEIPEGEEVPDTQISWAFRRAPVRVDRALDEKVYQRVRSMILTSATLTLAEGGFNFYLDRLGLAERISLDDLVQLPKEFNYAGQVMLGLPGYLRASARYDQIERFQEEMARELNCLFNFTEGRGLVLHTARNRMEYVAGELEKSLTHLPVYWQREGTSTRLLKEEFDAREESVLLGVRSFWEGIDVPGPSLSYLVIEKLPFPVPTDPVIEARREEVRQREGNEWMDYLIPLATLHFKQGFGRLIRKKEDHGVVIFLDKRLRSDTFYREAVLGSLPGYRRDDDLIEAEEDRVAFYRKIGDHMRPVFDWDWEAQLDLFPCIREEVLPDLERLLAELRLPLRIPKEKYEQYRDRLWKVASELIRGFEDFRPEQDDAMQSILAGQDTLVVLPTGSGKSLTFQLPALLREGVTLVFSPLIALMRDQVDRLRGQGLTVVDYIVSGQSGAHRDEVYRRMASGDIRLVYISPERIRDPALAEALTRAQVTQIVVDEAHCVHMWGPSFRPDFLRIPDLFTEDRPPIVALTATATEETQVAIAGSLRLRPDLEWVTKSIDRPELKFIVYNDNSSPERIFSRRDKLRALIKILRAAQRRDETAIVYTATVREAKNLTRLLDLQGLTVRHYHGRMDAQSREEVQELFREGIVKIIIATKAFGMGIDKASAPAPAHETFGGFTILRCTRGSSR